MGRNSTFTQEKADEICSRLSVGEPLANICRDDHMPAASTVSDWKAAHESFSVAFARAREEGEDRIAADCLSIADDGTNDTYTDDNGFERTNHEVIARSKLRIETRLKLLAKWNPKKYGDKMAIGGADDMPAIKSDAMLNVSGLSTAALAEILALNDAAKRG